MGRSIKRSTNHSTYMESSFPTSNRKPNRHHNTRPNQDTSTSYHKAAHQIYITNQLIRLLLPKFLSSRLPKQSCQRRSHVLAAHGKSSIIKSRFFKETG